MELATSTNPLNIIPQAEVCTYSALDQRSRNEFNVWSKIVQEVDAARSKKAAFAEIARRYVGVKGMKPSNIKTKYYAWKNEGWTALVNKAKLARTSDLAPASVVAHSPAFIEFWKGLQESNQRSSDAAYRKLLQIYRSNDGQIPGVGNWRNVWMDVYATRPPEVCPIDYPKPEGWSQRNLRRYKPDKFELTSTRIGRGAAAKYRPKVRTTRVGGAVGQIYLFDDVWHDNVVTVLGQRTPMRPLEFCCIDWFSGCQVAWGAQPVIEDLETGKRKMLEEKEMLFLLVDILCNKGYHPDGCHLQMEHGSATVRKELAEILYKASGEKLFVEKGGIDRRPAHDGYFACRPKGNSRFKAAIESFHNLKHNELAFMPGQVGRNRDNSPEALHGLIKYNEDLLKVCMEHPGLVDRLTFPTLEFNQWRLATTEIYQRINDRRDHNLEGWLECGHVQNRFQLIEGGDEIPMERLLAMDSVKRAAVEAAMIPLPPRKLSPVEVFASQRQNLVTLPISIVPLILGEHNAQPKRLGHDGAFTLEDMRIGPGEHCYIGDECHTAEDNIVKLDRGKEYLLWLSPFNPSGVFVAHTNGTFIGACKSWDAAQRNDLDAVHRQVGKAEHMHDQLIAPVKNRHAAEARQRTKMINDNNKVMVQAGLRPAPKKKAAKNQKAAPSMDPTDLINHYNNEE